MPKKRQLPTKTLIRKALVEAQFDPKTDSTMGIIASLHDHRYAELRAIEFIRELGIPGADWREKLDKALAMLALAKVLRELTQIQHAEPLDGHPENMQRRPNQARGIQK
jgi:hypothetical protein